MYEEGYFWTISLLNSLVMSLPVSSLHLFVVSFYLSVLLKASPVLDSISFSLGFALPWMQGKQFLCGSLCSVHTGFVLHFHTNLALLLSWEHSLTQTGMKRSCRVLTKFSSSNFPNFLSSLNVLLLYSITVTSWSSATPSFPSRFSDCLLPGRNVLLLACKLRLFPSV